jgi:hypothetical protein
MPVDSDDQIAYLDMGARQRIRENVFDQHRLGLFVQQLDADTSDAKIIELSRYLGVRPLLGTLVPGISLVVKIDCRRQ